jgi:hypothetical protein
VKPSIAFFQTTPPEVAGTVGAVFNSALQLGSALGVAAVTSVQTSVDAKNPGKNYGYAGRAAAFWFALALVGSEALAILLLYRPEQVAVASGDVEAKPVEIENDADIKDEKTVEAEPEEDEAQ